MLNNPVLAILGDLANILKWGVTLMIDLFDSLGKSIEDLSLPYVGKLTKQKVFIFNRVLDLSVIFSFIAF